MALVPNLRRRARKPPGFVVAVLALVLAPLGAFAATLLPLDGEEAVLLPTGQLEVDAGFDYLSDVEPLFRDVERNQWSAPRLGISAGLGSRAEVQFRWEALRVEEDATATEPEVDEYGTGDARLFTKIRVFSVGDFGEAWLPAAAIRFGVKLPNANFEKRLGTDEADFFGSFLVSRPITGVNVFANLGIGVLGNPLGRGQDDLFLYDVGAVSPNLIGSRTSALLLFGEVAGASGGQADNERSNARFGLRWDSGGLGVYAGGSAYLSGGAESFGVRGGLILWFRAFES